MTKQQVSDKANELLARMTIEEKVAQMTQLSYVHLTEEERVMWAKRGIGSFLHVMGNDAQRLQDIAMETRLGIPVIFGIDCIRGHALNPAATIFPCQLGMAASWNPEMVKRAGEISAREVIEDALHWVFSPVLCLGRDTRWGRVDESFGEDPLLSGELAAALVKGYQGDGQLREDTGVIACAKHYMAHGESTGGRDSYDVSVTERQLREIFLPPFKKAVDAGCKTIMTAYHTIGGLPCTANKWMLRDVLKGELGFEGFVVTDWDNVGRMMNQQFIVSDLREAVKLAIESGNDMMMCTPGSYDATLSIIESGDLDVSLIDEAVLRILKVKLEMGLFDEKKRNHFYNVTEPVMACREHLELNSEFTNQTVVMLENRDNTLPLSKDIKKIVVVGPNAHNIVSQYGDWSFFTHPGPISDYTRKPESIHISIWDGIREIAESENIQSVLIEWNKDDENLRFDDMLKLCENAGVVVAVIGDDPDLNGEEKDRANLDLPQPQQKMLESLKNAGHKLVVVGVSGKPLLINWAKDNADAMLWTFCPGMFGGRSVAKILFGDVNPSAKLPITFPQHVGQLPVYYNQLPGWHGEKYVDLPREPLYPFGYGLSYSDFEFVNLECKDEVNTGEVDVRFTVDVTNRSETDGVAVVQWYVRDMVSSVLTPVKQLKAFERVPLKAGEGKKVILNLPMDGLSLINQHNERVVEQGAFAVYVGDGVRFVEKIFQVTRRKT